MVGLERPWALDPPLSVFLGSCLGVLLHGVIGVL